MDNELTLKIYDYCRGKFCDNCIFEQYANRINKHCLDLDDDENRYVLSIIEEDKTMTKEEEIQQEIEKTQKQLEVLQKKLEEAKNEVPGVLPFNIGDELFVVNINGKVNEFRFKDSKEWDNPMRDVHRAFKSKNYAEEFAKKTQIIADKLHFKYLYDRDHKPDWDSSYKQKWFVTFEHGAYKDGRLNKFVATYNTFRESTESVYFSTQLLAERCAEWLNKKYGYTKE